MANRIRSGMGTVHWLFLAFVILKLAPALESPVLGWSWWWVTSPLWGTFIIAVIFAGLKGLIKSAAEVQRR